MESYVLLVIARSQSLARRLQDALSADEFRLCWVRSTALALGLDLQPALLILELPPSGGARSLVRLGKRYQVPILLLYRAGQPAPPSIEGSLSHSFAVAELAQLVQATLTKGVPGIVRAPGMSLDMATRRLQIDDVVHQLTPIGCQIMAELMAEAGRVIARGELFRRAWNTEQSDSTRVLDVHIALLRRTLEPDSRHPQLILTERGIGYRLKPPS